METGPRALLFLSALLITSELESPESEETFEAIRIVRSEWVSVWLISFTGSIISSTGGSGELRTYEIPREGGLGISVTLERKGCHPNSGSWRREPLQGWRDPESSISHPESQSLSTNSAALVGENHCKSNDHILARLDLEIVESGIFSKEELRSLEIWTEISSGMTAC